MSLIDPALEYFVAVYETGSINAAAKRHFIASSAVSRQLARLEREVGTPLFERLPQGLRATAAGNTFAAYARGSITRAAAITGELQGHASSPIVSVAGTEGTLHEILPAVIAQATAHFPALRVRLRRSSAADVSGLVRDGAVDLGVTFNLSLAAGVEVLQTFDAPVHAILRRAHPLAKRERLSFRELTAFPLVLSPPGATSRTLVDTFAANSQIGVDPALETDDTSATLRYVSATDAIALLSPVSLAPRDHDSITTVPMHERDFRTRSLQIQRRVGRQLHPAAAVLTRLLTEAINAQREDGND